MSNIVYISVIVILLISLMAMGQAMGIDVTVIDQNGVAKTVYQPGDEIRLKITPRQSPYRGVIAVSMIDPSGAATQPIPPVNLCHGVSTEQTVRIMQVTPQTPQGDYTVYVSEYDCANNLRGQTQRQFKVGQPPSPLPPSPPPPTAPDYTPIIIAAAIAVAIVAVAAIVSMRRREERPPTPPPQPPPYPTPPPSPPPTSPITPPPTQPSPPPTQPPTKLLPSGGGGIGQGGTIVGTPLAFLELPNGQSLPIASVSREFGRDDFINIMGKDMAQYISSRHFRIYFSAGQWYVEDLNSTNGTLVDGQQIKGKGPVPIKPGSVISPAGVIKLTFRPQIQQ